MHVSIPELVFIVIGATKKYPMKQTAETALDIPLMQYWEGSLDPKIEQISKDWASMHPELKYVRFDFVSARDFIAKYLTSQHVEAFDMCHLPAMQSDYFRVCHSLLRGGLYVDCGTEPKVTIPVRKWLTTGSVYLLRMDTGRIWNGCIVSNAHSKLLDSVLTMITKNILNRCDLFGRPSNDVLWVTGPANYQHFRIPKNRKDYKVELFDEGQFFVRRHDFSHKQNGRHWSEVQKRTTIFRIENEMESNER